MDNESKASLRQEILESQKARMDFLKFKLVAIAVLGAAALGLQGAENSGSLGEDIDFILCILPFVCIYVDFICYHNNIRVFIIAQHLQQSGDEYENFLKQLSSGTSKEQGTNYYFKMEDFVIFYTSLFVAFLIIIYGFVKYKPVISGFDIMLGNKLPYFLITGIIGFVIPFFSKNMFEKRRKVLFESKY